MSHEDPQRVLLIEDDPALARLAARKLQQAGYDVDVARNGDDGLRRYAAAAYDAVIVDYSLPGRDGLEVLRELGSAGPLPPTMMVTGSGSEAVAVEAMKLGVNDYIVKDVVGGYLNLLPLTVGQVIHRHRLAKQKLKAEEELKREKAFTEACLNTLQDVFLVIDPEGRLIRYNQALRAATGFSDEEIASMAPEDFFIPADHPSVRESLARTWQEGKGELEVTALDKNGKRMPYEISGSVLRDARGNPVAICAVGRDITHRRQAEAERRKRSNELRERVKELNCLLQLSELLNQGNRSLEETLQQALDLICSAWQYPEITAARLAVGNDVYQTANYRETGWPMNAAVSFEGRPIGTLEVAYLEERPLGGEGPFLKEERSLIDAVATRLGEIIEHKSAERKTRSLKTCSCQLEASLRGPEQVASL